MWKENKNSYWCLELKTSKEGIRFSANYIHKHRISAESLSSDMLCVLRRDLNSADSNPWKAHLICCEVLKQRRACESSFSGSWSENGYDFEWFCCIKSVFFVGFVLGFIIPNSGAVMSATPRPSGFASP